MDVYYVNGKFVTENEAVISVNDMAILRGYGVFDFLRTYGKRPYRLKDHITRLQNSARLIDLKIPCPGQEIYDIVMDALNRSTYAEANIRLVVTGGVSADSITPGDGAKLLVMITDKHNLPAQWYSDGIKIILTHDERYCPGAKTTNYIPAILALRNARDQNAVESVYIDRYNRVMEGTTTNIFVFRGNTLITPVIDILPGITRQSVLALAADHFDIEERDLKKEELRLIDEAFISASNKEIVPVVQIDGMVVGDGRPGARTRKIMDIFAAHTAEYARGK